MEVIEEVIRKKSTVRTENWRKAHSEIKDLLEEKFDFSRIQESKFLHHEEKKLLTKDIDCSVSMDKYTEITISLGIEIKTEEKAGKVTINLTGNLKTTYPENTTFQKSLFYFAMRSLWDKLFYGWARAKYRDECINLSNQVHDRIIKFLSEIE